MKICLDGIWKAQGFAPDGKTISFSGTVPGCVHTDLLREGMIEDPFFRKNSEKCRWIEEWNWIYEKTFTLDEAPDNAFIEFEGLDTYAKVFLNGSEIGEADNMFYPHAMKAQFLRKGENTLRVCFLSPVNAVRGLPLRSGAFTTERLYTRRMQCTYFWDWVDRFVTMGIFRSVFLKTPEEREIENIFLETRQIDAFGAWIMMRAELSGTGEDCFISMTLNAPDGKSVWKKTRRIVENRVSEWIDVPDPALWWPNGYGTQPMYEFVCACVKDGQVLSERRVPFGIRTIRILQKRDEPGSIEFEKCLKLKNSMHVSGKNAFWDRNTEEEFSGFTAIVNGVPVFCKGANWVPCEPFPSAETKEKIKKILLLARKANMNMIRVWGGGIFEQDAFYDACDRLGLMVTQDFLMACGDYPEEDENFLTHLRREAEHAVKRLRNHACLAWWSGDNENGMGADEDMKTYNGRSAALSAIGPVAEALNPGRAFLPSSPYAGRPFGSITKGTTHNTNYIGTLFSYIRNNDLMDYRDVFAGFLSRFCAEEPIMGVPAVSTLRRFMTDEDIFGADDDVMRHHTKNNPAEAFRVFQIYDYLCAISEKLLGKSETADERIGKLMYVQYEWVRITLEQYRRNKWFSSGEIYWMLNDCWPANGWAIIDYYARPKAAWYAFRRTAAPVIVSIEKIPEGYRVFAANDGLRDYEGDVRLFVQPFDRKEPIYEKKARFRSPKNQSVCVLTADFPAADENALLIAEISGDAGYDRTWLFEKRPQDCAFPKKMPEAYIDGNDVVLKADSYVHSVMLDGDCFFEDNYFSMLPGEEKRVRFEKEGISDLTLRILGGKGAVRIG